MIHVATSSQSVSVVAAFIILCPVFETSAMANISAAKAASSSHDEPARGLTLLVTVGSTLFPALTNHILSPTILSLLPQLGVGRLVVQYGRADLLALTDIEDLEVGIFLSLLTPYTAPSTFFHSPMSHRKILTAFI